MSENTTIEWCNHTFNPWRGCVKISAGCAHCYAETLSKRNPAVLGEWGKDAARVEAVESYWMQPLKWHKAAVKAGEIHTVFVGSLMDVGEDRRDLDPLRDRLMALIALTPLQRGEDGRLSGLRYLLLTKRPAALKRYLDAPGLYDRTLDAADWYRSRRPALARVAVNDPGPGSRAAWYPNLWIGTSVEDQRAADERIPELLSIDCAGRFLSMEPLLGAVDLTPWQETERWVDRCSGCVDGHIDEYGYVYADCPGHEMERTTCRIDWIIVGGESGPRARPMHPQWARDLRDQCVAAGVPFLFKQWGEWAPGEEVEANGTDWTGMYEQSREDGGAPRHSWPDSPMRELAKRLGKDVPSGPVGGDTEVLRVGKKAAGRLLDGQVHDDKPAEVTR